MLKRSLVMLVMFAVLFSAAFEVSAQRVNMRGADITIGHWWEDYNVNSVRANNDFDERQLDYRKRVLRQNNFTMQEKNIANWEQMQQRAVLSTMAGSPAANVFILEAGWAKIMQMRGLLHPVSDSRAVDFAAKRPGDGKVDWSQAIKSAFTTGGKTYAFGVGYGKMTYPMVIYYNKRLFREAGLDPDLPYNMQRDGTWTWANFEDICKRLTRDIHNRGIIDVYALCIDSDLEMHNAFISSNGANYVDVDSRGRFVNASNRPEFIEALNYLRRLRDAGVMKPRPENANWDWYQNEFVDGRVAMRIEPQWVTYSLANMRDDWGMVLIPKGPRVNDYVVFADELALVIPANSFSRTQVDQILRGVELWYTPFDDSPNAWKDQYYAHYRDTRAIDETLAIMRNPKRSLYKFHLWVPGLNPGDIAWQNLVTDLSSAQLVESVEQTWNAIIRDANDI